MAQWCHALIESLASVYPMNLGDDTHKGAFAGNTCGDGTQPCGHDAWRNYIYP